jgi:hypothetical protein
VSVTHLYYPQSSTVSADSTTSIVTTHSVNDATIATRDWILHQAQDDEELHMVLQDYPHALEHIAECLHYDFLWYSSSSSVPSLDDEDDYKYASEAGER